MTTSPSAQATPLDSAYSILDDIIAQTRLTADDGTYDIARRGVAAFIEELIKPQNRGEPVKKQLVDRMIAEIDAMQTQGFTWDWPARGTKEPPATLRYTLEYRAAQID